MTPLTDFAGLVNAVMVRDLRALRREIAAYPDDADLWRLVPGVTNSGGTLALHLTGNVQHFVGAVLGRTGYVRDRDAEFARRNASRADLLAEVDRAIAAVDAGLARLDQAALDRDYPLPILGKTFRTGDYLVHLATHFTYHLGQLDYHRRLVTGQGATVGAVSPTELPAARP
jgi:hypothetical protein